MAQMCLCHCWKVSCGNESGAHMGAAGAQLFLQHLQTKQGTFPLLQRCPCPSAKRGGCSQQAALGELGGGWAQDRRTMSPSCSGAVGCEGRTGRALTL